MTIADALILAFVLCSGLVGLLRGMVREVLGLVAWAAAILGGIAFSQYFHGFTARMLRDSDLVDAASFLIPFALILVFVSVIASAAGRLTRESILGPIDRFGGFLFGLLRGTLLIFAATVLLGLFLPQANWPPALQQARSLPLAEQGAAWLVAQVPLQYRPYLNGGAMSGLDEPATPDAAQMPNIPFGHPFGADPHSHVPGDVPRQSD